jgi:predicted nuclease of predicted toxin-antitoxin system
MVQGVVDLLMGRGHPIQTARQVGLHQALDADLAAYALTQGLVVVTFDRDLRDSTLRAGCPCLHIHARETTARSRLKDAYDDVIALLEAGCLLVSLDRKGKATGR